MKLSLKTVLRFAGIDLGNPLGILQELMPLIGLTKIQNEAENFFGKRITPQRRTQLVTELREMADNLEKNENIQAAKDFVSLLRQIKF